MPTSLESVRVLLQPEDYAELSMLAKADRRSLAAMGAVLINEAIRARISEGTFKPSEDDSTFREYKYSVDSLSDFTTFQIKIEMVGSVSSYPPVIQDMRAIALAV